MSLLPPEYKKELAYEAWRRFVLFFGTYFSAVLGIAISLLLPSYFFLQLQIENLQRSYSLIQSGEDYRHVASRKKEVESANRLITNFVNAERSDKKVSVILAELFKTMKDPGVVLSNLSYTQKPTREGGITLSGHAANRDVFRTFVATLQKSPIVAAVNSPITNLLEESNLSFQINIDLKP